MPEQIASGTTQSATIETRLSYLGPITERPRYYAHDPSRDVFHRDRQRVHIEDARLRTRPPSLTQEGFELFPHRSAVANFRDPAQLTRIYSPEVEQLVMDVSGADRVVICGPVVVRLSERVLDPAGLNILPPARLVHIDISDSMVEAYTQRWRPKDERRPVQRFAHYNVWRTFSPPPQDIPLAVCDARTVFPADLVDADSIVDVPGKPESTIVVVLVHHNPRHRWSYFSDMNRDEVLVFKSHDSDPSQPHAVPHSAFRDPSCPRGVATRASVEMRVFAFWFTR
jgi:hypothetical protein